MALFTIAASVAFVGPLSAPTLQRRAPGLQMGGEKKVIQFNEEGVFEGREVDVGIPPVYLLSGLEKIGAATALADAGVLSAAEEAGIFSTLESAGAFSAAEKLLPTIEKLGLLSKFEALLDVPNGFLFTAAITLLTFPLNLLMLQGFAIVPFVQLPEGPLVGVELLVDLVAVAAGAALFAAAYFIGLLQEATE